VPW
jgi:hypothetical protein